MVWLLMFNFTFLWIFLEIEVGLHKKPSNDRTTWKAIQANFHTITSLWVLFRLSILYFKIKFASRILIRKCNSSPDSNPNSESQLENPTWNPNSNPKSKIQLEFWLENPIRNPNWNPNTKIQPEHPTRNPNSEVNISPSKLYTHLKQLQ